jgi:hypothetical protein
MYDYDTIIVSSTGIPDVTDSLLAWFLFDEGSGASVADVSGNGHDGVLVGSPIWTTSNGSHGALQFDGVTQIMTFASDIPTTDMTYSISAWILPMATSNNYGSLLAEAGDAGFYFRGNAGDRKIAWYENGNDFVGTTVLTQDSVWYHVVAVVSGTSLVLYVNTVNNGNLTISNAARTFQHVAGRSDFVRMFKGKISNLRVYSRSLTAADINAIYNHP